MNHNEFNINPGLDIKTLSRKKSIGAGTDLLDESSNKSLVSLRQIQNKVSKLTNKQIVGW